MCALWFGASDAHAQHCGYHGGLGSSVYSGGHVSGYGSFYGFGGARVISPSYGSLYSGGYGHASGFHPVAPVWHDTSHLDYHGPSLQRHRNHFHLVPGHYDVHREGHWDVGHH